MFCMSHPSPPPPRYKPSLNRKKPKPVTGGVAWAPIYREIEFRLMCSLSRLTGTLGLTIP